MSVRHRATVALSVSSCMLSIQGGARSARANQVAWCDVVFNPGVRNDFEVLIDPETFGQSTQDVLLVYDAGGSSAAEAIEIHRLNGVNGRQYPTPMTATIGTNFVGNSGINGPEFVVPGDSVMAGGNTLGLGVIWATDDDGPWQGQMGQMGTRGVFRAPRPDPDLNPSIDEWDDFFVDVDGVQIAPDVADIPDNVPLLPGTGEAYVFPGADHPPGLKGYSAGNTRAGQPCGHDGLLCFGSLDDSYPMTHVGQLAWTGWDVELRAITAHPTEPHLLFGFGYQFVDDGTGLAFDHSAVFRIEMDLNATPGGALNSVEPVSNELQLRANKETIRAGLLPNGEVIVAGSGFLDGEEGLGKDWIHVWHEPNTSSDLAELLSDDCQGNVSHVRMATDDQAMLVYWQVRQGSTATGTCTQNVPRGSYALRVAGATPTVTHPTTFLTSSERIEPIFLPSAGVDGQWAFYKPSNAGIQRCWLDW